MILTVILWIVAIHVLEIAGVLFFLLIKKNSRLEKIVTNQNNYINAVSILINQMDESFKQIDSKLYISDDEELKTTFQNMQSIQSALKEINDSTK